MSVLMVFLYTVLLCFSLYFITRFYINNVNLIFRVKYIVFISEKNKIKFLCNILLAIIYLINIIMLDNYYNLIYIFSGCLSSNNVCTL